jgi:hypothetical protein
MKVPAGALPRTASPVVGIGHFVEDAPRIQGLVLDVGLLVDPGADGNQVVDPGDLQPVACIIKQPDAPLFQPVPEIPDGLFHLLEAGVLLQDHRESEALKRTGDVGGVVDGVFQGREGVCGVADHQGHVLLGGGGSSAGCGGQEKDDKKKQGALGVDSDHLASRQWRCTGWIRRRTVRSGAAGTDISKSRGLFNERQEIRGAICYVAGSSCHGTAPGERSFFIREGP